MADSANLTLALIALEQKMDTMKENYDANNNAFFMCAMALIIFFMQCGFAFLEAGAVRSKNTTNILIKNVLDSIIVIICYWATGWAFAYGDDNGDGNGFIGTSQFFLSGQANYPKFFFQYVFAATASTIVSGAIAERCEFITYIVYCSFISGFVYPVVAHWGWSSHGWLAQGIDVGDSAVAYIDFAGSGVVHVCGGTISFIAAYMIGPRIGRFPAKRDQDPSPEIQGHSVPFAALGGFILMFGFLAFNGGSAAEITTPGIGNTMALAMINTIMSGSFAAIVYILIFYMCNGKWTCLLTINAALTGMVAACSGCNRTMPWGSVIVGTGAGLVYLALSKLMVKIKVDDPLDAFAVHFGGGFWGLIVSCIVSRDTIGYSIVDAINGDGSHVGVAFAQLGWNVVGALSIMAWSAATTIPVFFILKKLNIFRVPPEVEIKGLDIFKHGEAAYPIHAYGHGWDEVGLTGNRKISALAEVSMEELAEAYERKTSVLPAVDSRKISFYHNRDRYEHPEKQQIAMKERRNNLLKNGNGVAPAQTNGYPIATGPVLGVAVSSPETRRATHWER